MRYLSLYEKFITEQTIVPDKADPEMTVSKKNTANQYTDWLNEFNQQKNQIAAIFADKSLDDKKRKERLKPFLQDENPKEMVFKNDLLKIWSDVCNLNRKITDLDTNIEKKKVEMDTEQKNAPAQDADGAKRVQQNVDLIKQMISNFELDRQGLEQEILKKEKEKDLKIKQYQTEFKKLKQEINLNK